jgi:hypothetical protein
MALTGEEKFISQRLLADFAQAAQGKRSAAFGIICLEIAGGFVHTPLLIPKPLRR